MVTPPYAAVVAPEGTTDDAADFRPAPIWRAEFLKLVNELGAPVFLKISHLITTIKLNLLPSAPQFTANTIPAPQWLPGVFAACAQYTQMGCVSFTVIV